MATIYKSITALLAPAFQLAPADRLRRIFHRALYGAALIRLLVLERTITQLEVVALPNDVVELENEGEVVGLDEAPEVPEPPEDEMGMPANQAIIPGAPGAHAGLTRSLYGFLRPPTP